MKHLIEVKTGKRFCDERKCWDVFHIPLKRDGYVYIAREGKRIMANYRNIAAHTVSYVKLQN